MKLDPYLSPVKDLNIRPDTSNLIEVIDTGKNFLNRVPEAKSLQSN